jgi:hypothetical protein
MTLRAVLLSELVALLVSLAGAPAPAPRVLAVLKELDRISSRPLWPGFDPRRIPVAIFDGGRTWLSRHPNPPEEFHPWPDEKSVAVFEGRHASHRANTAIELAGVPTATASFEGHSEGTRRLAGLLVHETFHVFQARRHPKWGGNEVEQLTYPSDDAEVLAERRLESLALSRALSARSRAAAGAWAARALAAREKRFARLTGPAAAYERGTEMKEGLATYVETKAVEDREPFLPVSEFPPEAVRLRAYASGNAISRLLDRLDPAWKSRLEKDDALSLDALLLRAVAGIHPAEFSAAEEFETRSRAASDVEAMSARRANLRREFLDTAGWTLVLETADPVFPQGFDPWNLVRVSASEVLHTRWLKLGNAAGSVEILDHKCLTEGSGKHPLFEGVRHATVTGLAAEPRVEEIPGRVKISADGLTLEFRGARVTRTGQTLTVTVNKVES